MPLPPVGIDLGTTNSVVAYCRHPGAAEIIRNAVGETITPSVIAFDATETPVVGRAAVQTYGFGFRPGAALFKRAMGQSTPFVSIGGRDYTPEDLSALVLSSLAADAAKSLGGRAARAVISVPAYFRDEQRRATLRAAEMAGLDCMQLINEPTAAAIAFKAEFPDESGRVLVFDLGGGTFDVSVLTGGDLSTIIDTRGDPFRGGADWDAVLMGLIAERAADVLDPGALEVPSLQLAMRREAEAAKIRLSTMPRAQVSFSHDGQSVFCEITREEFEAASVGLVDATLELVEEVLDVIGTEPDGIDDVLLVGGSTRMPMIETALTKMFGRPPRKTANPDEAVALGAALLADHIDLDAEGMVGLVAAPPDIADRSGIAAISDIANFSLGIIAVSEDGDAYVNEVMIPRGATLPAEGIKPYRHVFRIGETRQLEAFVTQGEGTGPDDVGFLGLFTLDDLPGAPDGKPCEIEISYNYDASGIGRARARLVGRTDWVEMERQDLDEAALARFDAQPPARSSAEPASILMVFDVSGSMTGPPIDDARAAARRFLESFDPNQVAIGIGVVANRSAILLPPTHDHDEVARVIRTIETGAGNTGYGNQADPFDDIYRCLGGTVGARTAVVLADGIWDNQDKAVGRARRCHSDGIEIVAIGFGSADEGFLNDISSADELSLKVDQRDLVATFGSIAQVVSRRSGLILR